MENTKINFFQIPTTCGECQGIETYCNLTYCSMPSTNEEYDITAFEINSNERPPDWCPLIKTNEMISVMPQEKQIIIENYIKASKAMFDLFRNNKL